MPDLRGADELDRFAAPLAYTRVGIKKETSPKNWEISLFLQGSDDGASALRALRRCVQALVDACGQPVWQGGARWYGEAYDRFVVADMRVLAT